MSSLALGLSSSSATGGGPSPMSPPDGGRELAASPPDEPTAAYVLWTIPADGAVNIPLSQSILVMFSQSVNTSTITWSMSPPITMIPTWDPTVTLATLTHPSPLATCTNYTAEVYGVIPGPAANPWTFRTFCPTGSSLVTLISPVGGEDWTGGSTHSIIWNQSSPSGADIAWALDWLDYSTWVRIANGTAGNGTQAYTWTVPSVDRTNAQVRVCAGPPTGYSDCSTSGPFTIDSTAPVLVSHDPPDGAIDVPVTMFVTVVSSENTNQAGTERAIISNPPAFVLSTTWPDPKTIILQLEGLRTATRYVWGFDCTATDSSNWGNPLANCTATHDFTTEGGAPVSSISLLSPRGGESWTGGSTHDARFVVHSAEPVTDVCTVDATFRYAGGARVGSIGSIVLTVPSGVALDGQISWVVPGVDALDVIVNVTATNRTGVTFWDESAAFEIDSTPPQVLSFSPSGLQITLDPPVFVRFSEPMAIPPPDVLPLTISPSIGLAATWAAARDSVSGRTSGSQPCVTYTIRLISSLRDDSDPGNAPSDTSAAVFTIDSTPPALLVSFPADGASGHKSTWDLWFVWTEGVDRSSFATAFGLSPDPGGLGLEWSVSNLGGDVLLVTHNPLKSRTAYSATFAITAKDDSDPGNFLAAAVVVGFTTRPPPPVNPPVALAVGHNQVEVGEPTTFDGTGSSGVIRDYVWRIADNHGAFVAVLVGPLATYTFQQQGRYSVTLFVTDVNGVVDDDTIEIAVTSNPHSDALIAAGAAGAALAAAALVAGTEGGKLAAFQFFLFPLYARRKRDELLDHETRGMIRGYILVHPGDSYSDIRSNLGLSNGTLSYHLMVLEREGIVRSHARGSRKLFYPRDARLPNDGGGMHEVQIRMLHAIEEIPGLAVTDLAGALGITSQLALYHLRALAKEGRIRFERRGFRLRRL